MQVEKSVWKNGKKDRVKSESYIKTCRYCQYFSCKN